MRRFINIILLIFIWSIGLKAQYQNLQPGDILFQDLDCGDLCEAIESVTEGVDGRDFSHCGLVVHLDGDLLILEAIGEEVQLTSCEDFYRRSNDNQEVQNIIQMRLKNKYSDVLEKALIDVNSYIGMPYDHVFLMDNGSYYCSELIYDIFKEGNDGVPLFSLAPMTYKKPGSDVFFPAWVYYYQELNAEIPEGKPGINPGLISRSDKLEVVE